VRNSGRGQPRQSGPHLHGANLFQADLEGAFLGQATLGEAFLVGANLSEADLSGAVLGSAVLSGTNLSRAVLSWAGLSRASLFQASLPEADLRGAQLWGANLSGADLSGANLSRANLTRALLVETNLVDATLTDCRIYGISAWDVKLNERTNQQGLIITDIGKPKVTIDDLEVAQFVYLLLRNEKVRRVIDAITSKVVLILGRFSIPERKAVLDALRNELHKRGYVPVVFEFGKPTNRATDETITLLARMARFVIADISDAKSVLQELRAIVPDNPSVPVQSIINAAQDEPGMFDFFKEFRSFLKVYPYRNPAQLLANLDNRVIAPPEAKAAKRGASAKLASTRLPPSSGA
jgi:uncharacterized protein YjbI with pentapeptide repeats